MQQIIKVFNEFKPRNVIVKGYSQSAVSSHVKRVGGGGVLVLDTSCSL